ncbi:hypothetical protein [Rhizobium halophytocola]|uniref:Uncharacterized protein n=1 Tax=Rhizobium halophytocola TaxID=735519 RepID=A0ABS4E5L5_9HYPH|nr:hypothetical protein [Rhizobium halophytocola]MBP1853233.1 hypothetical protein [Rhizobium halophytocola]
MVAIRASDRLAGRLRIEILELFTVAVADHFDWSRAMRDRPFETGFSDLRPTKAPENSPAIAPAVREW